MLGDLCERYTSPAGYVLDALQLIPVMMAGQLLRSIAASRAAPARATGRSSRSIVVLGNWLATSRPILFFGGWYVLLSVVSVVRWMHRGRAKTETTAE